MKMRIFCGVLLGAVMGLILCLYGCSSLEGVPTEDIVAIVATEVVEAVPIVVNSPNVPGVLMAVLSVIAGIAGGGMGAAAHRVAIKKKVADGVLGKNAIKKIDEI